MLFSLIRLFFLYLPFQIALNPGNGFDIASIRLFAILIFILWILQSLKSRKIWIAGTFQPALVLSFLFLSCFSVLVAQNTGWSIRKLLFLFSFFPLYFVFTDILQSREKILSLTKSIVAGSGIIAILGIGQFLLQWILPLHELFVFWTSKVLPLFVGKVFAQSIADYPSIFVNISGHTIMRAIAIFPDPHMFAFYLGMTLPLAIGLTFVYPKQKTLYLFIALCIVIADLLTFSRGGYIALLAGIILFLFMRHKEIILRSKKYTLVGIIILTGTMLFPNPIRDRLLSSFNPKEGSNQGRIEMWMTATETIAQYPLLGTGIGNYPLIVKPTATYRDPIYAHNLFLDIAVETGILTAIFFILIIMTSMYGFWKQSKTWPFTVWPILSLIIFTIHSLFETPLYSVHVLPLLLFLMAISIRQTE